MGLTVRDFIPSPTILPPSGGLITFQFRAQSSGNPSHMRAKIRIPQTEPFVFMPAQGADPKEIFFPGANNMAPAPTQLTRFVLNPTSIVSDGAPDRTREEPLKVHLELQGLDSAGQPIGSPRTASLLITIDTLSTALTLLSSNLNLSSNELSKALGVSTSTLRTSMRGGHSPRVRAALDKMFRGQ